MLQHILEPINFLNHHREIVILFVPAVIALLINMSKFDVIPNKIQGFIEVIYEFLEEQIRALFHSRIDYRAWMPFIITLFFYVLIVNLSGLIPGVEPPSSNLLFTGSLAGLVIIISILAGIKKHGIVKYFVSLTPAGVAIPIRILMFPLELVSILAKPLSLALRLYANMFAGHMVIKILLSLTIVFTSKLVIPLDIIVVAIMLLFEVMVSFIQAYIFAYLSAVYISDSIYQDSH